MPCCEGRQWRERQQPTLPTCAHNDGIIAALWQSVRLEGPLQRLGLPASRRGWFKAWWEWQGRGSALQHCRCADRRLTSEPA